MPRPGPETELLILVTDLILLISTPSTVPSDIKTIEIWLRFQEEIFWVRWLFQEEIVHDWRDLTTASTSRGDCRQGLGPSQRFEGEIEIFDGALTYKAPNLNLG